MKKYLLLLLIIPAFMIVLTGCNKEEKKDNNTKTIELSDDTFGYKTTFTYNKDDNYSNIKTDTESGKSTEIEFENEDLDLEYQMYYTDMSTNSYKDLEESRANKKYYKKYTFGEYKAYAYGDYTSSLDLNILIDTDKEEDRAKILFVSIERIDSNEDIIVSDVVKDKEVQEFFNSMKVEKLK